MSGKKYFECAICGAKYEACYSCNKKNPSLSWKNICDTAEHYKIFQVVNGYTAGVYTKDEAMKKLNNVDLSDVDSFRENIKDIILDIKSVASDIQEPKPKVRRTRKRKSTTVDESSKADESTKMVEDEKSLDDISLFKSVN